jgi:hypothetical protein
VCGGGLLAALATHALGTIASSLSTAPVHSGVVVIVVVVDVDDLGADCVTLDAISPTF